MKQSTDFKGVGFASLLARKCLGIASLGCLGFLGFIPGLERLLGFTGFFGFIGLAFIVEFAFHLRNGTPLTRR